MCVLDTDPLTGQVYFPVASLLSRMPSFVVPYVELLVSLPERVPTIDDDELSALLECVGTLIQAMYTDPFLLCKQQSQLNYRLSLVHLLPLFGCAAAPLQALFCKGAHILSPVFIKSCDSVVANVTSIFEFDRSKLYCPMGVA